MSHESLSAAAPEGAAQPGSAAAPAAKSSPAQPLPPLFRPIDWLTFALTFLAAFIGYQLTLAPDVTLQDSGELAVGSFYAGVPHPPGYPVWTIYTWLATVLFPVSNVAYRVAAACSLTSALACGLLALQVSRGSSMMIEGLAALKNLPRRTENLICVVSGFVAGCLLAFNGFYWSQSVIVEVYCFGVFSFMITLCCLMRWLYAPHQRRYLYLAAFVFGICFTNHQTLLVATMGIEVALLMVKPSLGRNAFAFNSFVYLLVLFAKTQGYIGMFDTNLPLFIIFNAIGLWSIYTSLWVSFTSPTQRKLLLLGAHFMGNLLIFGLWAVKAIGDEPHTMATLIFNAAGSITLYLYQWLSGRTIPLRGEWRTLAVVIVMWCLGAGFYFYMPLTSMSNPPMNWGYPRTYDGFIHALTRGQYERTNPTSDFWRFLQQLSMYVEGAVLEFNPVYLLLAVVPFFFLARMPKRERSWIIGLAALWFFQGMLLLILLNPGVDRQSRDLNKVFFNASFAIISMLVGCGLALLLSHLAVQYERYRQGFMVGLALAAGAALYGLAQLETSYPPILAAHYLSLLLAVAAFAWLYLRKDRAPVLPLLGLAFLMPLYSVLTHWAENEQHNHKFGFWFGHDMFTPPDFGRKGELYPEMARNAILFGGTDPGRFCPTYMIFCESFIPAEKRRDPSFDRRDVYLITQNALADGTYLNYIRAHYNRSAQQDPPFFQRLFQSRKEIEAGTHTNFIARMVAPLDTFFTQLGKDIEARRRGEGVYPRAEIHTPTAEESQRCFDEYSFEASQRLQTGQLKPNEGVRVVGGKVMVYGQVAVMQINGLLAKVIFDANPTNEFYIEESLPLDWMYPHLTPFGVIMKVNREPVKELTEEILRKDHLFWSLYSERLVGNWIESKTTAKEICDFAKRTYRYMDFRGYKGSREFARDNDAQKAFSKLRCAIGGLYAWRLANSAAGSQEQKRLLEESEFAFKQAFAFCPYSPEATYRYANVLINLGRFEDAQLVAATYRFFDPESTAGQELERQIQNVAANAASPHGTPIENGASALTALQQAFQTSPTNIGVARQLASTLLQARQTNQANAVLDQCISSVQAIYQAEPGNHALGFNLASLLSERQRNGETLQTLTNLLIRVAADFKAHPDNREYGLILAQVYFALNQFEAASRQLDAIVDQPPADPDFYLRTAQMYAQMGNAPRLEHMLLKVVQVMPEKPEAWYDLAAVQCGLGKTNEALVSLGQALNLHRRRLKTEPDARDLITIARQDPRLEPLRKLPGYSKLLSGK